MRHDLQHDSRHVREQGVATELKAFLTEHRISNTLQYQSIVSAYMFWHGAQAQDWLASGQNYAWNNPDLIKDRELVLKANQQLHVHQPQKSAMQIQKLIGSCNISAGLDLPLLGNMPSSLGCMMMTEQPSNTAAGARHWMATCTNNRVACATQTCHRQPLSCNYNNGCRRDKLHLQYSVPKDDQH